MIQKVQQTHLLHKTKFDEYGRVYNSKLADIDIANYTTPRKDAVIERNGSP